MKYYILIKNPEYLPMVKLGPFSTLERRSKALQAEAKDSPKSLYYLADVYSEGRLVLAGPVVVV